MGLGKKSRDTVTDPSAEASPTAEELAAQADVLTHSQCEQAASPPPPKPEAPPRTHTPAPPTRVPPRAQLPNTVSLPRGDGYQIQYLSHVQLNGHQLTLDIVPR